MHGLIIFYSFFFENDREKFVISEKNVDGTGKQENIVIRIDMNCLDVSEDRKKAAWENSQAAYVYIYKSRVKLIKETNQ